MNKYGIEHFSIKQLEECSEDIVNEREQYWIQKLDTYGSNGYNATRGGDSKHYYNYKEIADKYLELQNQKATAEYFNCSTKTVRIACKQYTIKTFSNYKQSKKIKMVSLKGKTIQVFNSMSDAGRWLVNNNIAHGKIKNISYNIGQAAKKEKIAYGYG